MMKLPTSYLQEPTRSAVRFTIVGGIGTALQYAIYYGFLMLFEYKLGLDEELRVNVAFILGFCLEMIANYIATCYYTFQRKPDLKNAGGFMMGRVANFLVQMGVLNLLILDFIGMDDRWAGMVAIVLAGIVNFFVLRFAFKK